MFFSFLDCCVTGFERPKMLNKLPKVFLVGTTSFLLRRPLGRSGRTPPDLESLALACGASENEFLFEKNEFVDYLHSLALALTGKCAAQAQVS
jgi:hypothetical protein